LKLSILYTMLFLGVMLSCQSTPELNKAETKEKLNTILDDWHEAAADADFERYFRYMESASIFMGTDATEYWSKTEFKEFAKPYFDRGKAWNFTPVERHIYLSENHQTAWFDEELDTPNLGPARGSGVLVKLDTTWKITHYNLSIPIPNAIVDGVVEEIREFHEEGKE